MMIVKDMLIFWMKLKSQRFYIKLSKMFCCILKVGERYGSKGITNKKKEKENNECHSI